MASKVVNMFSFTKAEDKKEMIHSAPSGTVLDTLDNAGISWFHIKAVVIAGMGFFTDAYDLFNVGLLNKLIAIIYYGSTSPPLSVTLGITCVALCGTLAGQLFFGYLGDVFGRKSTFGVTLAIMVVAAVCSGLSFGRSPLAVITGICFWRFILGFGIGGDYPLSATIMSEYSNKSSRGAFIAAVFAMQGIGYLTAAAICLLVSGTFMTTSENPENADYVWRVCLIFGAIPTLATAYARNKLPETARFTLNVKGDVAQVESDMNTVVGATHNNTALRIKKFKWTTPWLIKLFGCASCWFLLDIAFYSQSLFQSDIYLIIGWVPKLKVYWPAMSPDFQVGFASDTCSTATVSHIVQATPFTPLAKCPSALRNSLAKGGWMSPLELTYQLARANAIISLASIIPGYWFTVFTIEHMGRWNIQMMGFFFMTVFMAFIAGYYDYFLTDPNGFITMYVLAVPGSCSHLLIT
jgi:PHS family inorganic phosphate transporter-like MFS transporter